MRRIVLALLVALVGCKDCVGANSDKELLPELTVALESVSQPQAWRSALAQFEKDARVYRRPELGNRIARLAYQAEAASQPESLCSATKIGKWVRAHLTRLQAEFQGQPTTPVEPVLCGSAPWPIVRGVDASWNLYGLDLNAGALSLAMTSSITSVDVTRHLHVVSAVRAEVRLTEPDGLRLAPDAEELVLKAGERVLSRLPLTDARPPLRLIVTEVRGLVAAEPTATATAPAGQMMIGGGCRASFHRAGQVLVASYPSGPRAWTCRSKEHLSADPSSMTAYVLSIPNDLGFTTKIAKTMSPRGGHISSQAHLPAGYQLIGGGCRLIRTTKKLGHLLTVMKPGTRSYQCEAKDHIVRSQAMIEAYAIGIPDDVPFTVVRNEVGGDEANTGHVSARLPEPGAILVGGGCAVAHGPKGNFPWTSYPRPHERRWVCAHKDHRSAERGTPTAYAIGLRSN